MNGKIDRSGTVKIPDNIYPDYKDDLGTRTRGKNKGLTSIKYLSNSVLGLKQRESDKIGRVFLNMANIYLYLWPWNYRRPF